MAPGMNAQRQRYLSDTIREYVSSLWGHLAWMLSGICRSVIRKWWWMERSPNGAVWPAESHREVCSAQYCLSSTSTTCQRVFVWQTHGSVQDELIYYHGVRPTLSVEEQLFLTLVKLRQNKVNFELSCLFDITERSVTNVFVTWVNFMAVSWDGIDWWPFRDTVWFYSPTYFVPNFPRPG